MLTRFDGSYRRLHTFCMRYLAITPFLLLVSGFAQIGPADMQVATLPLKHEQVAVYREALWGC
jgi:hypothetical protein